MNEYFFKIIGMDLKDPITCKPITHISAIARYIAEARKRLSIALAIDPVHLCRCNFSSFPKKLKNKPTGRKRISNKSKGVPKTGSYFFTRNRIKMKTTITIQADTIIETKTLLHKLLQDLINMPIKDKDLNKSGGLPLNYDEKYGKLDFDLKTEKQ